MEDLKWLLRKCGLLILLLLIFVIVGVICWGKMHEEEQKVAEEVWEPPVEIENSEAETEEAENAETSTESAYWFIPQASDDLLSEKIAPLRRRKHILHRGDSPQIDVVFELADRMTQPLVIPHGKSLAARGFYALYLRRFQYCSRFRLASCFRRSCLAQAGQYLARLEEE